MLDRRNYNCKSQITYFLILMVIGAAALSSCENDIAKVRMLTEKGETPIESAKDLQILYSDSAKLKARVKAKTMNRFEGEEPLIEMPDGIELLFYDNDLNVKSTLTANRAVNKVKERTMEAFDDVVVVNDKGEQLNTEYLRWEEKTGKLYSDQFVKISTIDQIIYGEGFEAEQDFSSYRIFKTKGIINVKQEDNEQTP